MLETTMPATEVNSTLEKDPESYELAFHVLPTVAEGEVSKVFDVVKDYITKLDGEIFAEEAPARFDLAYEIIKHLEGKNRKFGSAYFGWVRFRLMADRLATLTEELSGNKELLRYLLIKLTKVEEQNTFRFHESIASRKVENIGAEEEGGEEAVEEVAGVDPDKVEEEEVTVEVDDSVEVK